jgi:hypothetical protein
LFAVFNYTAKYKLSAPEDEKGSPFHLPVLHPYLPKCCILIYRFAALLITESVVLLITDYKNPDLCIAGGAMSAERNIILS